MATAAATTETLDQKRLLKVLTDYRRGDFSTRMPADRTGVAGKICDALNDAIERNEKLVKELERLSNVVGKAGNIKQRATMPSAEGQWANGHRSGQHPGLRPGAADDRSGAGHRRAWPRATCRRAWRSRSTAGR